MRTVRSAAPVFAARRTEVFDTSAMAVKIANTIPAVSAAVRWRAQSVLTMFSGVGRLVAVGVAMKELSCPEMWTSQIIYAEAHKTFLLTGKRIARIPPGWHTLFSPQQPRGNR